MDERGFVRRHAKGLAIGALLGLLTATGIAVALWQVYGGGTGYTKGGQIVAPTSETIAPSGELLPGQNGSLYFRFHNPNPVDLKLININFAGATVTSSNESACPASNLTVPPKAYITSEIGDPAGTPVVIPAGGSADAEILGAVTLSANAQTACQNTTFSVVLTYPQIGFSTT